MTEDAARALSRKINREEREWDAQLYGGYGPTRYGVEVRHMPSDDRYVIYRDHEWPVVKADQSRS